MSKMSVARNININAPVDKVHEVISNFNHWQPWSPWLIAEPEAEVKIAEDGKSYSWEGNRVGSGEMEIANETDTHIDYNLTFLKPWKSKAKVTFNLKSSAESTDVEWTMDSKWPFFLFFMKKQTEAFIGMDYDRGLKMLKEYVEDGEIQSKLEFLGNQDYAGCNYVGITTTTPFAKVGESMENDFNTLYEWSQANNVEIVGEPFSQYHKFDVVKGIVNYTSAIPVKDMDTVVPNGAKRGSLPKLNMHTVRHHGSYEHLGNAWSTVMMQQRAKEFKALKKIHPIEFYKNDPADTAPKDLITDVSFAVK